MDLRELVFFLLIQVLYLYPNPVEEIETIKMMMKAVVGQTMTALVVMKVVLEKMEELQQYVVKEKKMEHEVMVEVVTKMELEVMVEVVMKVELEMVARKTTVLEQVLAIEMEKGERDDDEYPCDGDIGGGCDYFNGRGRGNQSSSDGHKAGDTFTAEQVEW